MQPNMLTLKLFFLLLLSQNGCPSDRIMCR